MAALTLENIDRLSPGERLELISRLWESLAEALPLSAAQQAELDRRLETFERDRTEAVTWDDPRAELAAPAA